MKAAVQEVRDYVRAELERLGTPEARAAVLQFFKPDGRVDHYGVRSPEQHRIAREVYARIKKWPAADRNTLCEALWRERFFEDGAIVCYVYRRFAKQCGAREFHMFARWMDRHVHNWAHTDGVAAWLLAASIANEPDLIADLRTWTRSPNRWKRRASAVALVPGARAGLYTDQILEIAAELVTDDDDMVQKGVGWLLKETYPKKKAAVMRFLLPRKAEIPRLVLRYAAEKMTAEDRRRVMAR